MKLILILFSTILFAFNHLYAQTEEEKSLKQYNAGQITKFFSKGIGKSQGLKIHFKYPKSWKSIEGERPHVVRRFAQSDNFVGALILVNKQDEELTQAEINEFFTTEGLKYIIPASGNYISSNNSLKIEGLKAGSVEFTNLGSRMNRYFYSHNLNYVFIYKQYIVSVQFIVINKIGESNSSVTDRFKKVKPLFYQMFNSIVIDNIWE